MTIPTNILDKIQATRKASYCFMINPDNNNCISFESSPKIVRFAVNDAALHIIRAKVYLKTSRLTFSIAAEDMTYARDDGYLSRKLKGFFYGPFDIFEYEPRTNSYLFIKRMHTVADEDAEKIFEMIDEEVNSACVDIISSEDDSRYNSASFDRNLTDSSFFSVSI